MKKCRYCDQNSLIKKGFRGIKQRYLCKTCGKSQQDIYTYKLYNLKDDKQIKILNAEGVGINSMSRILGYSQPTIIRRILHLSNLVVRPIFYEDSQVYEVDELCTHVGKKDAFHYSWITYAINRENHQIVDVAFGSRNKENLKKVIDAIKMHNPKKN